LPGRRGRPRLDRPLAESHQRLRELAGDAQATLKNEGARLSPNARRFLEALCKHFLDIHTKASGIIERLEEAIKASKLPETTKIYLELLTLMHDVEDGHTRKTVYQQLGHALLGAKPPGGKPKATSVRRLPTGEEVPRPEMNP